MNNQGKNIIIWAVIFGLMVIVFNVLQGDGLMGGKNNLAFSDFLSKIDDKQVNNVKIYGRNVEGTLSNGSNFTTYTGDYQGLIDRLNDNNVHIEVLPPDSKMSSFLGLLAYWFPTLLLIGVYIFFMRQMQGGGKGMGFGKSKAKLLSDKGPKITFKEVAGIDEAKEELNEIVDFLRDPSKFQKLGGKIPKGCLLIGPPGTGKTLLAKAIAGEANVPFFSISGSDFVEMFVGVGASRVRDMFEQGKRNAPCIIFIDEIDAVGRHRGAGHGGGNDEREQTLNQMLVEMDGFDTNEGVVIIAATNRPDVLDTALLRPGRFDRQITVSNPDINGRDQILQVHLRKVKVNSKVDPRSIARGTSGFSGAALANLVNEAALLAARRNKKEVDLIDLEDAKDKVLMGVEKRSMIMSDEEKLLTAYHEAGHALVGLHYEGTHPIHKATIIPRGRALGMVQRIPDIDRYSQTRNEYEGDIAVLIAGRVTEELIFGHNAVTSGASSDIKAATNTARAMVVEWGFSEAIGPINHGSAERYGRTSEQTAILIDSEVKKLINEGYNIAKEILISNMTHLHLLAKTLLEKETLTGQQIKNLLLGRDLDSEEIAIYPAVTKTDEIKVDIKKKAKKLQNKNLDNKEDHNIKQS